MTGGPDSLAISTRRLIAGCRRWAGHKNRNPETLSPSRKESLNQPWAPSAHWACQPPALAFLSPLLGTAVESAVRPGRRRRQPPSRTGCEGAAAFFDLRRSPRSPPFHPHRLTRGPRRQLKRLGDGGLWVRAICSFQGIEEQLAGWLASSLQPPRPSRSSTSATRLIHAPQTVVAGGWRKWAEPGSMGVVKHNP